MLRSYTSSGEVWSMDQNFETFHRRENMDPCAVASEEHSTANHASIEKTAKGAGHGFQAWPHPTYAYDRENPARA